jgi:hypothetical protein
MIFNTGEWHGVRITDSSFVRVHKYFSLITCFGKKTHSSDKAKQRCNSPSAGVYGSLVVWKIKQMTT